MSSVSVSFPKVLQTVKMLYVLIEAENEHKLAFGEKRNVIEMGWVVN